MIYKDYIRVLCIDLQAGKIRVFERKDLTQYLGGVGVASKLLEEYMRPELPPLAPEQPVIFANGVLSTIFPVVTKTIAMFISPLTGELGESHMGGRMARTMFEAGYDAIVITGKASHPIYLAISECDVQFREARSIWGKSPDDTYQIIRERETGHEGKRSLLCIGEAGENLVSYACGTIELYRHAGRLGLGAVLGSKLVKAVHVIGSLSIPIENFKEYFKVYREIFDKATEHGGPMAKYHDAGTPINVEPLNKAGGLPTLNLQKNRFEQASWISGDYFAQKHLIRKLACVGCPVGCIHIGQVRRAFFESGYEFETIMVGYDYELIFALGSFLGIHNAQHILELIEEVEKGGLDAMSAGVALGWATEALENGLVTIEDTVVPLRFGEVEGYRQAIAYISTAENEFYTNLGKGVRHAAGVYGGGDFAMQIAGNEMPGYHTGYGSLVGTAVAARHSHLCNGGYSIDQGLKEPTIDPDSFVESLLSEEVERCMLNSLVMCLFARKIYDRETVLKALASIGKNMTDEELTEAARRIYATKLRIKKALGFDLKDVKLPKRFFKTPTMHGVLDEALAYEILEKYRERLSEFEDPDADEA